MRKFIVMVGLSGSGKSYHAAKLAEALRDNNPRCDEWGRANIADIISSDSIREELLGDASDQSQNELVFKTFHHRIKRALYSHHHVIVDATNISIKSRKSVLECFKAVAEDVREIYIKSAYVLCTPSNICKQQNAKRTRVVPEYVIDRQLSQFEIPFYNEGFDHIVLSGWEHIWDTQNFFEGATAQDIDDVCQLMKGFDQRTHHHKYTLDIHCQKLKEELEKRSEDKVLIRTALLHDIGKLYTGKPKEDGSGDYCYYSHHNVGAYTMLQNIDKVGFPDKNDTLDLLFYVNYHMLPFFLSSEKARNKWKKIFGEEKYEKLLLFNECDKLASGGD